MTGAVALLAGALATMLMLVRRSGVLAAFARLAKLARRAARIMRRPGTSDHSKERAARLLAAAMMARSLDAGARLLLVALPLLAALTLAPRLGLPVRAALVDPYARLALLALGGTLVLARVIIRSFRPRPRLQPA